MVKDDCRKLGLVLEDITTEVARFDALGSWGEFDWVLGANARYTDFERKPSAVVEGAAPAAPASIRSAARRGAGARWP